MFLGIDPGYGRIGYGIIETKLNIRTSLEYGVIETSKDIDIEHRLVQIRTAMLSLFAEYRFDACGVEKFFFRKNLTTGVNVLQARGVILYSLAKQKIPIYEFTPTTVKKLVTGNGRATKSQVQLMVGRILAIETKIQPDDAADALAMAIATQISAKKGLQI